MRFGEESYVVRLSSRSRRFKVYLCLDINRPPHSPFLIWPRGMNDQCIGAMNDSRRVLHRSLVIRYPNLKHGV